MVSGFNLPNVSLGPFLKVECAVVKFYMKSFPLGNKIKKTFKCYTQECLSGLIEQISKCLNYCITDLETRRKLVHELQSLSHSTVIQFSQACWKRFMFCHWMRCVS